jgi:hypothetical protein
VKDYPLGTGAVGPSASYRTMLEAIEESAKAVRKQDKMDVAQQSGSFYEDWFVKFYTGRRPQIDALWPFVSWAKGSLPMGLQQINPLRMTIAEWTQAQGQDQDLRQSAVSLERLGFRRDAEKLEGPITQDPVVSAMMQSIRKRGYEKASVILLPLENTLTKDWLPSENIACRLFEKGDPNLASTGAKYLLVEVDEAIDIEKIRQEYANLRAGTRVGLFGTTTALRTLRAYPYIVSPQGLDDLVELLDARPTSDWPDPKSAPN